jgi:hypothetical protein
MSQPSMFHASGSLFLSLRLGWSPLAGFWPCSGILCSSRAQTYRGLLSSLLFWKGRVLVEIIRVYWGRS